MRKAPARLGPQSSAARDGFDPDDSILLARNRVVQVTQRQRGRSSVRVADVQNASVIPFYPHGSTHRTAQDAAISRLAIVELCDPLNVIAGLRKAWHAGAAGHRTRSSVIGSETQADVTAVVL